MSIRNTEVQLTGWKAIAVCLLVVSFVIWKYLAANQALQAQGANDIRQWIAGEYTQYHADALQDYSRSAEERAELLGAIQNVQLQSLQARGSAERLIVKVEIEPSLATPPGSSLVRYYEVSFDPLTQRVTYRRDSSAFSYRMAFF